MGIAEVHAMYRDFYNYISDNHPQVFNEWKAWYDEQERITEEALTKVREKIQEGMKE